MQLYQTKSVEQLSLSASILQEKVLELTKFPGGLRIKVEQEGFISLIRIEDEQKMVVSDVGLKVESNELWFFVRQRIYGMDRYEEVELARLEAYTDEDRVNQILSAFLVAVNDPNLMVWRKMKEADAGLYW